MKGLTGAVHWYNVLRADGLDSTMTIITDEERRFQSRAMN
jgi:hypothetical protein